MNEWSDREGEEIDQNCDLCDGYGWVAVGDLDPYADNMNLEGLDDDDIVECPGCSR
jgi:hypothetical protein